jgi:hypothetical protein
VPLLDLVLPGFRYDWSRPTTGHERTPCSADSGSIVLVSSTTKEVLMKRTFVPAFTFFICLLFWSGSASAFCGFYAERQTRSSSKPQKYDRAPRQ